MKNKTLLFIFVILILTGLVLLVRNKTLFNSNHISNDSRTFNSDLLGVGFSYPSNWGELTEEIRQPFDKMPYKHWRIVNNSLLSFRIEADNKQTAEFSYEGLGDIVQYYGQPMICVRICLSLIAPLMTLMLSTAVLRRIRKAYDMLDLKSMPMPIILMGITGRIMVLVFSR